MNHKLVRAFTVGAIAVGTATMSHAQQNGPTSQGIDVGKYEYDSHCCAICHGSSGTGPDREPYWNLLSKDIPNLTTLSQRNGGVFPIARVYEIIDGRQEMRAHGPRDMPIWGREFTVQSLNLSPYYDREAFARAKILSLAEYIYRLQAK